MKTVQVPEGMKPEDVSLEAAVLRKIDQGRTWPNTGIEVVVNSCWRRKDEYGRRTYRFHYDPSCCEASISKKRGATLSKTKSTITSEMDLEKAIREGLSACQKCCDLSEIRIQLLFQGVAVGGQKA